MFEEKCKNGGTILRKPRTGKAIAKR